MLLLFSLLHSDIEPPRSAAQIGEKCPQSNRRGRWRAWVSCPLCGGGRCLKPRYVPAWRHRAANRSRMTKM